MRTGTGKCVVCKGRVKSGGNIHGSAHHAFTPRHERHQAKLRAKLHAKRDKKRRDGEEPPISRGITVGGLKKGGAKSGESRK